MPEVRNVTGDGVSDEGFLGTLIPIIFMIAVSTATYLAMDFLNSEDPVSGVLVYSIADWVPATSDERISPEDVGKFIAMGEQAVVRAADAGYIVIPAKAVMRIPSARRLKPDMFPPANDGGSVE